tara:strand:+ start:439 stop:906 length:468 start_codon:yes stop_codon:yes gene_type:complete
MERITLEKAKQFISCGDDFSQNRDDDPSFYTLEPAEDGWENVKYYTSRKLGKYENRGGGYDSWVYILSNPTMNGYYKIGYTKKNPEERAKQISNATGVIVPMKVEWAFHCYNGYGLEQEVHNKLDEYRINSQREFFQLSLEEAKSTIKELGKMYI